MCTWTGAVHAGLGWWKRCGNVVHVVLVWCTLYWYSALGLDEKCMLVWYGALGLDEKCMLVWYGALGLDEKCMLVWNNGNG